MTEPVKPKLTMDRAAARFSQIAALERQVEIAEAEIKEAEQHVKDAKAVVSEWREKRSTLLADLRTAARDEGALPLLLFLFDEDEG